MSKNWLWRDMKNRYPTQGQHWSRGGEKGPEDKWTLRSWVPLQRPSIMRMKEPPASGE